MSQNDIWEEKVSYGQHAGKELNPHYTLQTNSEHEQKHQ